MNKIRICAAALAAALLFACVPSAAAVDAPALSARRAVLLDAGSGRVLYEKNADERSLIASTTKIMTGLLVCEYGYLEEEICVPSEAVGVEGSSMYLKSGEQVTLRALLYGMMLRSGNDAALALAIHIAGSPDAFAARMNARARALGLRETHFANPHGLDSEQNYSTARDLALLTRAAMQNETFREVVSTKSVTAANRCLTNHNKLLWRYDGAIGVKTGYTKKAGRILVSAAERDGRTLIAVTIDDPDDWRDHARLLDYGFSQYTQKTVVEANQTVVQVRVTGGEAASVALVTREALCYPAMPDERAQLRLRVPVFVRAPVFDEQAGTLELVVDGEPVACVPVYYAHAVAAKQKEKAGLLERLFGG